MVERPTVVEAGAEDLLDLICAFCNIELTAQQEHALRHKVREFLAEVYDDPWRLPGEESNT